MRRKGFTLIELLIVVIIIGILVATVLPRLAGKTRQARIQRARTEIYSTIATALDMYEMDFGRYPEKLSQLWDVNDIPSWWYDDEDTYAMRWNGPYLKRGANIDKESGEIIDPWGQPYYYDAEQEEGTYYTLRSFGPNGRDEEGEGDDISYSEEEI